MEQSLTLIYTGELRGNLEILPHLYTFVKSLRARMDSGRTFYVDIGGACDPDVWHCDITEGRSMLVALDGMGCAVANVSDFAPADVREKLGDNVVMALVDEAYAHVSDELIFTTVRPTYDIEWDRLAIVLAPAPRTRLIDRVLAMSAVTGGQVGVISLEAVDGVWGLAAYSIHNLPVNTPPDPTIAGAVDFILREAHQAQKRRGR